MKACKVKPLGVRGAVLRCNALAATGCNRGITGEVLN